MTEHIRFHFDPIRPWCYQTSRWLKHLAEQPRAFRQATARHVPVARRPGRVDGLTRRR